MKINVAFVLAAILSCCLNTQASSLSVKVPSQFDNGPAAISALKLESNELAIFMLLEGVMDISSSAVLASGCHSVEANYPIELISDGGINKPETNAAKITSPSSSEHLILNAILEEPYSHIGQNINIRQVTNSKLKETHISEYAGVVTVNQELTLLSMHSNVKIPGQNNTMTPHHNIIIKNFYEEKIANTNNQYILGWGLVSLSKSGFPINKYWIRFKALRINGQLKRVVMREDQLLGTSPCQILVDSSAEINNNNQNVNNKNIVLRGNLNILRPNIREDRALIFDF